MIFYLLGNQNYFYRQGNRRVDPGTKALTSRQLGENSNTSEKRSSGKGGMGGVPSFSVTDEQKASIIKPILADPDSPSVPQLESEINHLVYTLYNLTPDELKLIEGIIK
jgi:hypothetical protein